MPGWPWRSPCSSQSPAHQHRVGSKHPNLNHCTQQPSISPSPACSVNGPPRAPRADMPNFSAPRSRLACLPGTHRLRLLRCSSLLHHGRGVVAPQSKTLDQCRRPQQGSSLDPGSWTQHQDARRAQRHAREAGATMRPRRAPGSASRRRPTGTPRRPRWRSRPPGTRPRPGRAAAPRRAAPLTGCLAARGHRRERRAAASGRCEWAPGGRAGRPGAGLVQCWPLQLQTQTGTILTHCVTQPRGAQQYDAQGGPAIALIHPRSCI